MKTRSELSRELMDLALLLMGIIKQEFKAGVGVDAPTLTQFKFLCAIKGGNCHVGKLSEAFGISQPATSKMIEVMVKDKLLKKVGSPSDRRQVELRLTAKAKTGFENVYRRAFSRIDSRLAAQSPARKRKISKQVRELIELIKK